MARLGDFCDVAHGAAFPLHYQGKTTGAVPFFKVSDMNAAGNEELLLRAANYVDEQTAKSLGARVCPAGTIVFPKVGGALLTNKKRTLAVPAAFDNNMMGLVPNRDVIDPRWLRLWFELVDLAALANVQAMPSVRQSAIANLEVTPPTTDRQLEVARGAGQKLDEAAVAKAAVACQRDDAGLLVSALFREVFAGTVPVVAREPEGTLAGSRRWQRLMNVARLESGHTPSRRRPEWWGGNVPWLALPDIRRLHGKFAYETLETTNDAGLANSSARLLPVGTVCVSRTASIGFVTILGRPMATSQDFCNWICDPEKLDPEFLMYAFMASQDYLRELGSGAVHKTIYMPTIQLFHICAPPIEEQRRIARRLRERLAAAEELTARLRARFTEIERLPQRILAAAFGTFA